MAMQSCPVLARFGMNKRYFGPFYEFPSARFVCSQDRVYFPFYVIDRLAFHVWHLRKSLSYVSTVEKVQRCVFY